MSKRFGASAPAKTAQDATNALKKAEQTRAQAAVAVKQSTDATNKAEAALQQAKQAAEKEPDQPSLAQAAAAAEKASNRVMAASPRSSCRRS